MKKLLLNLENSLRGLKIMFNEHSFVLEFIGGLFLIPYILFTDIDNTYKILILLTYFILLAFEIINTAIEKLCNKITKKYDKDIKVIKDISSASVFVILIILLMTIIVIYFI